MIKLNGEKKQEEEKEKIENRFHNTREFGKFCVEIPLKSEDLLIKREKPTIVGKNGIIMLTYQLEKLDQEESYEFGDS